MERDELLRWWDETRRDLPWRRTRDPWAILVSELMLQQTQVARVVPRYHAFLSRYPNPGACVGEPAAETIRLWAGLGYNTRAVNLHRSAELVVERHGGAIPGDLDALLALPGIGPYTARAVMAFAFERDVAVLDTNVGRVVARQAGTTFTKVEAQAVADALVPEGEAWRWNQAMLDLGATVCTKRAPTCPRCPVRTTCAWRGRGADPAVGSGGTSGRQTRFEGSDRQGRGRLVDALRAGPVDRDGLAEVMGWPDDPARAVRVASTVVADGIAIEGGGCYALDLTGFGSAGDVGEELLDDAVREGGHLLVGPVLDRMVDEHAVGVEAEGLGLAGGRIDEDLGSYEDPRDAATLEIGDVVHTARRAATSIG